LEDAYRLPRLKNWNEFKDVLEDTRRQKAEAQLEARQARIDKRYAPPNPYASYPAESMEHLANIVGLKIEV
jgi:Tfp pilus assembly protein PilE